MEKTVHALALRFGVEYTSSTTDVELAQAVYEAGVALLENLEAMERALKEAYPFVESAGHADNSGGEYLPRCQECEPFIGDDHTKDCQLNTWLEANKALAAVRKE